MSLMWKTLGKRGRGFQREVYEESLNSSAIHDDISALASDDRQECKVKVVHFCN